MEFKNVFGQHLEILLQILFKATLVIFVLGSFFVDNPNFLNMFKWIGIAYLLYLAYDIYNSRPKNISSDNISSKKFFFIF